MDRRSGDLVEKNWLKRAAVAETEATPATRRGRQLLKQWIPPPLWQLVERYEADWNGQVDDDYYDSIDHCHQRVSGLTGDGDAGRPATPAAVGARAVVSSLLTMFCVYSTNQVYVPYNTYQDAKEYAIHFVLPFFFSLF